MKETTAELAVRLTAVCPCCQTGFSLEVKGVDLLDSLALESLALDQLADLEGTETACESCGEIFRISKIV